MYKMKSVVAYVRSLLGWCDENPDIRTSFKRDRVEDDFSSDDDFPTVKKLKQMRKTNFPDVMAEKDLWDKDKTKVRYIPIQIDRGHPSTSTPNRSTEKQSKVRTVPIKLVGVKENGGSTPYRRANLNRQVLRVVDDGEGDCDDQEVTWIENKPEKPSKVYIDLDEEESDHNQPDDDVIFVKKISTPPPLKPYKYFIANSSEAPDGVSREPVYYKLSRKLNDRNASTSPRAYSKFKAPVGITKIYKKAPTPVPKWMQESKSSNLPTLRNRYLNLNGNLKTTLSEVFNLDEKKNYQELIRRVTTTAKPVSLGKPGDIISLAEDAASFRLTQKTQKKALDELKFVEKGLSAEKENEVTKEYDPITVASINSSDSEVEIVHSESSTSSVRIDPINSLRESFKDRAVISSDWLSKLDTKYKKKKQQTQEKLVDARRESDIITKVNNEQKIAHLENKLKYELSIPESLFEEPQPTVELPPLTPEQEKLVNRALGPGPPGQVLVEKFNLRIHRRDLQTLSGLNWLNDEVINFYMNLLMQRSEERKDLPKVYATNTFFYPKLMQSGQAGLRRWTRRVDIFAHDLMVVPVHLGVHWCVSMVDFQNKKVSYLDSMGSSNQACLDALMQYLRDEHQDKKGQPFDDKGWKAECLKNIPQQMNGSDCGMFACTFAEFSARGAPYTFTQAHMPYLRRKAALEILAGRLLL
ncbi:sentrin-specific protease 1-like isoform X2 [Achroia grisella]|uniref:sentrin-specific protease 1-like isoform X2 n=1 Tax=Achroia grisella TaxID=688607 RepID=UPI0027D24D08|nr:sentrin-specific protease 1-like isoform X2 [Achroia grisella]